MNSDKDTKPCPFCGEEIKAAAIKCRFCGEMLPQRNESSLDKKNSLQAIDPNTKLNEPTHTKKTTFLVKRKQLVWLAGAMMLVATLTFFCGVPFIKNCQHQIDLSTIENSAKSLCNAVNKRKADIVNVIFTNEYFLRAQKDCNDLERTSACGNGDYERGAKLFLAGGCGDIPKEYDSCKPLKIREHLLNHLESVSANGSKCQIIGGYGDIVNFETYNGIQDEVQFEKIEGKWLPKPIVSWAIFMNAAKKIAIEKLAKSLSNNMNKK